MFILFHCSNIIQSASLQPPDVIVFEVLKSEPKRHTRVDVLAICSIATHGIADSLTKKLSAKESTVNGSGSGSGMAASHKEQKDGASRVCVVGSSREERVIEMWVDLGLDDETATAAAGVSPPPVGVGAAVVATDGDSGGRKGMAMSNRMMQLHARIEWVTNSTD